MPGPPADEPPPGATKAPSGEARGLDRKKIEPEDYALAVPRGILIVPRYVLTGIFWPITKLLNLFDDRVVARMRRTFFWTEDQTVGWRPVLAFQPGYGFSVGGEVFAEELFGKENSVAIEARGGGLYSQAYDAHFHGEHIRGSSAWLDLRARVAISPRLVFAGLGNPPSLSTTSAAMGLDPRRAAVRTRYTQTKGLAFVHAGAQILGRGGAIRPGAGVLYNHRRFAPERTRPAFFFSRDDDRSIEQVYDVDLLTGFDEGVDVANVFGSLDLDFRNHPGQPSSGFRYYLLAGGAPPQARGVAYGFYGTEIQGFFDLHEETRVLLLRAGLEAVHGDDEAVPFSALPTLGGLHRLRGYRLNRFRDHIALLATAEYRYPIHQYVSGHLFIDVGRVARSYSELPDVTVNAWRMGVGGGVRFRALDRLFFRVDIGYGDDVRVYFSTEPLRAFADEHRLEL